MTSHAAAPKLARLAWLTLGVNVGVVLWGAVVRATSSGAGCGRHWPKCNGELIPELASAKTLIEYSHRLTSGVALILVFWLGLRAYRARREAPHVLGPAIASVVLMVLEALLGAGLVLLRLVELDASVARAISMSLHLTNTFFLLGAMTWTAAAASFGLRPSWRSAAGSQRFAFGLGMALLLFTGISGAIAALGDTLFPATTLAEGLSQDTAPAAHFLLRLRGIHPFFAVVAAALLALGAHRLAEEAPTRMARLCRAFQLALLVQLMIGGVNLVLLVPLWTQLVHLLSADAVLILFALIAAEALDPREALTSLDAEAPHPARAPA